MMWLLLTILLQDPESLKASLRTEDPVIQPQTERLLAVKALSQQLAAETTKPDYIVAFSQSHCSPCRRWERIELPKLLAAGIRVRVIMIDEPGQDQWRQRVRLTPTYWICDGATQTCRADDQVTGYTTSAVLVSMMARKSARVADGGKQINRGE